MGGAEAPLPGEPGEAGAFLATLLAVGPETRAGVLVSRWDQVSLPLAGLTRRLTTFTTDEALARALTSAGHPDSRRLRNLDDLPPPPGEFDVLVVSRFLEGSPDPLAPADLISRVARLLKPGAALCLCLSTPWLRAGAYRAALAWGAARAGGQPEALRAWAAAFGSAVGRRRIPPVRASRQALRDAGFCPCGRFSAFPDARYPEFLVPLERPAAAAYVFSNLVERPGPVFTAMWAGMALVARAGLFPLLVSNEVLIGRAPETAAARAMPGRGDCS